MTGTERKVFQKYYPPDFDPSKIPKASGPKNRQFVQRVMTPCNMKCDTCGEYIYKAKKFNMRRETAEGEDYLGLRIFRFYFRCPNCLAEITFKTDLENCDYQLEQGATRLFEAYKLYQEKLKEEEKKELEDSTNPMKMLEKRTKMSRAEMEAIGTLEEIRDLNRRNMSVSLDSMIGNVNMDQAALKRSQEEEDEAEIRRLFNKEEQKVTQKRIKEESDSEEDEVAALLKKIKQEDSEDLKPSTSNSYRPVLDGYDVPSSSTGESALPAKKPKTNSIAAQRNLLKGLVKPKRNNDVDADKKEKPVIATTTTVASKASVGLGLVGDYGSASDSD